MDEAMRKCGNVPLDASDKADDAKYSFPKGTQTNKCIFAHRVLQIRCAINGAKKGAY